jgi:hypothetical protein
MTNFADSTTMKAPVVDLLVDGLATYRLVKLIRDDRITEPVRDAVESAQGPPERSKVTYLLNCPWCLSIYFGAAVTLGRHRWPRAAEALSRTLALSALTGLATTHLDPG